MNIRVILNRLRFGLLIGAVLVALTEMAHAATEDRIEKTFIVTEGGDLVVDVDRGSIDVKTGTAGTVHVEVIRKLQSTGASDNVLENHHVEMVQEGNLVRVRGEDRSGVLGRLGRNLQVRYLVAVPRKFSVQLKTKGGSITVNDLDGKAEARTSGGSLNFGEIQGSIRAHTSGGSIHVKAGRDKVTAETSGGSIKIGEAGGDLVAKTGGGSIAISRAQADVLARTSGGSIDLAELSPGKVEATTSGGSVSASFTKAPKGDCTLKTSGGSVRIVLPADAAVDLDAKSGGGRVSTDFPVSGEFEGRRTSLQTKLNGGGPRILAHTTGGGVSIGKR